MLRLPGNRSLASLLHKEGCHTLVGTLVKYRILVSVVNWCWMSFGTRSVRFASRTGRNNETSDDSALSWLFQNIGGPFRLTTWNCRGLCHFNLAKRKSKFCQLHSLLSRNCVTCLQEVHGNLDTFRVGLHTSLLNYDIGASFCAHRGHAAGGVVTMIPSNWRDSFLIVHDDIIPGRVLRTSLSLISAASTSLPFRHSLLEHSCL